VLDRSSDFVYNVRDERRHTMYEGYEKLKPLVEMIGKTKDEMDALEVVVKIILSKDDPEIEAQAIKYVNDCLDYAREKSN
jgi:esterase/lipase